MGVKWLGATHGGAHELDDDDLGIGSLCLARPSVFFNGASAFVSDTISNGMLDTLRKSGT